VNASCNKVVNAEFTKALLVLVYLAGGTAGIALLVGWLLKHFGPPKRQLPLPYQWTISPNLDESS
jgi:hypothetical protein